MNYDNPVFAFLTKAVDMVFLCLLWSIFCLPVVTIIPASGALYYTVAKNIRKERGNVFPLFWRSFKSNLKAGIPASFVLLAVGYFALVNGHIALNMEGCFSVLLLFCDLMFFILVLFSFIWAPPILARFQVRFKELIKDSLKLAFGHFGVTLLMLLLLAVTALLAYITYGLVFFIAPSLLAYAASRLMERRLNQHIGEDSNRDKWYLE